jgi:hypothetical protein
MGFEEPPTGYDSSVKDYSNPEWMAAKQGLVAYRKALLTMLIVAIGGVLVFLAIGLDGGLDSLDAILWTTFIIAAVSLAISAWMVYALFTYSKVPAETGARGLATAAMVIYAIGFLAEVYGVYMVGQIVLGGFASLEDFAALKNTRLDVITNLNALAGFICLVTSLKKVAIHVGAYHVRDMISSLVVMLFIIIGIFVVLAILPVPALALLGGLAVLVLVIVALVKFLRILKSLGDAIGGLDVSKVFD